MSTGGEESGLTGDNLGGVYVDINARTGNLDQEFATAYRRTKDLEQGLLNLKAQVRSGAISMADYRTRAAALAAAQREAVADFNRAREALDRQTAATLDASEATVRYAQRTGALRGGFDSAGRGASNLGYKLQSVGQTLDDLQYVGEMGLRPVLNNIMQLSAGVGVFAIVAYNLYTHWDQLMGLMGMGKVATEAEEMERLASATKRTADEEERLARYKRRKEAESAQAGLSDDQQETERLFNDAIRNAPGGQKAVVDALVQARNPEGLEGRMSEEDRQALEQARVAKVMNRGGMMLDPRKNLIPGGGMAAGGMGAGLFGMGLGALADKAPLHPVVSAHDVEREILAKYRAEAEEQARKDLGHAALDPERRAGIGREVGKVNPALADQFKEVPTAEEARRKKQWLEDARKEQADRDKAEEEAATEAERQRQERQSKAEGLARGFEAQFGDAFLMENARGVRPDDQRAHARDAISRQLLANGEAGTKAEADRTAGEVADALMKSLREKLLTEAHARGTKPGVAAESLLADRQKKETDRADQEERRARSEQERLDREAVKKAETTIPALDEQVQRNLMQGRLAGQGDDKTREMLEAALRRENLSPDEAGRAAARVVGEQGRKLDDQVARKGLEPAAARAPETHDAASMVASVQAAVSGQDQGKAQTRLLEKLVEQTKEQLQIARRPPRPGRAVLAP